MRDPFFFRFFLAALVILSGAGCYKKSGEAVVLEKEHIAVREVTPIPTAEPSSTATGPTASRSESTSSPTEVTESTTEPAPGSDESTSVKEIATDMHEDEVHVDGYVMKKAVRGTSKDPRAMDHERWIVRVRMVADLRLIDVNTDQPHWDKVKAGDQIKVSYRQGKYTGTVWDAHIE